MMGQNQPGLAGYSGGGMNFSGTLARALVAMIAVSLFLAVGGIYWATRQSDEVSVSRQARTAQHAMESSVDELALQQETVAIWDDAAKHLVAAEVDMTWIHDNFGSWLNRLFRHDDVFILNGFDRPVYAAVNGLPVAPRRYTVLSPDLEFLINSVRGRNVGRNGRHDRNPGRQLSDNSTVRTTSRATHDSHIMVIGGRPAAASAMLIQPSTPNYVRPQGNWPVIISVRYLDRGFLSELATRQLINAPRFSRSPRQMASEHRVSLTSEGGRTIGYLIWKPELPGTRILWDLVPFNLMIFLGLALFIVLLGRRLHHVATGLAAAEANSKHLALHDSLTGLPNRSFFQLRLDDLSSGEDSAPSFALVLLDIDEFKLINDSLGHDAGDAILLAFADRLKRAVHSDDLVARLGGDEFALLLLGNRRAHELEAFCCDLLEKVREPSKYQGKLIHCNASIGASYCDGIDSDYNILKHADLALYEAKNSGRGAYRLYAPSMWSEMLLRNEMLSIAEEALKADYIRPFYQPKVDLQTGAIIGFEALLRYCRPGEPPQGPECVAAAFEDSLLAVKLSDRMIEWVIKDISTWRAAGLPFGHVAINAALGELRRGDFATRLLAKLRQAGIPPQAIQIEVTESVLLGTRIDNVERAFMQLAESGIKLALDDFGTGFASLTHLKRFPIEIIKIDRSFVRDMQIDAEDGVIVEALIGLGTALKIEVVAEGIETQAQWDFLSTLGCTSGQGFLFGDAIPSDRVSELFRKPSRRAIRAAA